MVDVVTYPKSLYDITHIKQGVIMIRKLLIAEDYLKSVSTG